MKVFISHAHEDQPLARGLAKRLREVGLDPWSCADILPGENWASKVAEALDESEAMIVLISPAAAKSEWVRHEIQYALGSERYADRVIPVVIEPSRDMPWYLSKLHPVEASPDPIQLTQVIRDRLQKVAP